jgi:hypothetical protein
MLATLVAVVGLAALTPLAKLAALRTVSLALVLAAFVTLDTLVTLAAAAVVAAVALGIALPLQCREGGGCAGIKVGDSVFGSFVGRCGLISASVACRLRFGVEEGLEASKVRFWF